MCYVQNYYFNVADDTDEHARIMHRNKSRDSSPAHHHYVKAERLNDSSCDVGEDEDEYLPLGSNEADEEHGNGNGNGETEHALIEQRRHRRKKISHSNSAGTDFLHSLRILELIDKSSPPRLE